MNLNETLVRTVTEQKKLLLTFAGHQKPKVRCCSAAVIMEELEMTREAFQKWIRVNLKHQVFMEVEEKCKRLQSLLDRREKLSAHLLQLCRSVFLWSLLCALNSGIVNLIHLLVSCKCCKRKTCLFKTIRVRDYAWKVTSLTAVKYWITLRDLIFFSSRLDSFSWCNSRGRSVSSLSSCIWSMEAPMCSSPLPLGLSWPRCSQITFPDLRSWVLTPSRQVWAPVRWSGGVCTWPECTNALSAWLPLGTLGVTGVISNGNMLKRSASRCARGPEVEAPIRVLLAVLALVLLWSCSNFHFCRSVARCEALVKKQYSFLGWEYTEPDSDDDQNATGCGEVSSMKEKPRVSGR